MFSSTESSLRQIMKRALKITALVLLVTGLAGVIGVITLGPSLIARDQNTIEVGTPPPVSAAAGALHERLVIADLHADLLLWSRDPLTRADFGHIDIPRLIKSNVALQGFSAVTQVPAGRSYARTEPGTDLILLLALIQRWPAATWSSRTERAMYQASKLHEAARRSAGTLTVIRTSAGLTAYLARRVRERNITAGILTIEGLHALDGKIENLDRLYDAGYRIMGLTHFFDNKVSGSAHGVQKGGLTNFGKKVLTRMEALSIIVDLAHASARTFDETLDFVTRPVIVSHTGVAGTCPGPRNLTDVQIRRIADNGGVIGIGFFAGALCDIEPAAFAGAVRYVTDRVGIEHVGLGSDFDGSVHTKFDVTGLPHMTESLMEAGFTDREIEKIMGGNVLRLLAARLPASD